MQTDPMVVTCYGVCYTNLNMENDEFENTKRKLLHFRLSIHHTEEKGRFVTANKDFKQGDLVFRVCL
jgi:hypothetical protein